MAMFSRSRTEAIQRRRVCPAAEQLESRMLLYSTLGAQWAYGIRITYSFVPDGTSIGGVPSALYQAMSNRGITANTWQSAFQKAAALWENVAGINLVQVSDDGSPYSVNGNQQGDYRFGDIRIGGIAMSGGILAAAFSPPPVNGGAQAGDIVMNTTSTWNINGNYDVQTIALHEFGHALGLDHSTVYQAVMYAYYSGVNQTLSSDDTAGMRQVYGTRSGDSFEPNNTYLVATNITPYINSYAQISIPGLDISSSTDNDYFKVVVPRSTNGTMTVKVQSAGLSSLSPKVMVYDGTLDNIWADARVSSYGDTAVVAIGGVVAGQTYYIRALNANGGAGSMGAYGLQVNFGSWSQAPISPPNTIVPSQPNKPGAGWSSMTAQPNFGVNALTGILSPFGILGRDWDKILSQLGIHGMKNSARIAIGDLSGWGDVLLASPLTSPRSVLATSTGPESAPELPSVDFALPIEGVFPNGPTESTTSDRLRDRLGLALLDAVLDLWNLPGMNH